MATLEDYGWDEGFERAFAELKRADTIPGRVVLVLRGVLTVRTASGRIEAVTARRLLRRGSGLDIPTVGDWVVVEPPSSGGAGRIIATLPRRSKLARKASGTRSDEQVVAANVDAVLVIMGLDGDFNVRRLERFLVMVRSGGCEPVVVLNKADLSDQASALRDQVAAELGNTPVVAVSAETGDLSALDPWLVACHTLALVGSSGVGKSTLINALLGEDRMRTGAVRSSDDRGTHTTTHRELIRLPSAALLIDNPGIREVQPWEATDGLDETFEDVESLAEACHFRNCTHVSEPGCAVLAAVEDGTLDRQRLAHQRSLVQESADLDERRAAREGKEQDSGKPKAPDRAEQRRRSKLYRQIQKERRRRK